MNHGRGEPGSHRLSLDAIIVHLEAQNKIINHNPCIRQQAEKNMKQTSLKSVAAGLVLFVQISYADAFLGWWDSPDGDARSGGIDLGTCTSISKSNFNIQVMNMGSTDIDPSLAEAFELAAQRWSKVIVGDVTPDFPEGTVSDWFSGQFSTPFAGAVDDLVIGFEIAEIDGLGEILGSAGPVFTRLDASGNALAPISGVMIFDVVDVSAMPIDDFKVVVLHEMGHVLGLVGSTTDKCTFECSPDSFEQSGYSCPLANAEYEQLVPGALLQLENEGGTGTACSHWEEDSFASAESSELMTGYFEADLFQPLSLVTVAALDDLGVYEVDYCGADVWPATAQTQQKFQVLSTSHSMDMDNMMLRLAPVGMMDANGNYVTLETPTDQP